MQMKIGPWPICAIIKENDVNNAVDLFKKQAAWRAVELVESGMAVGLGAGSTAVYALRRLAQLLNAGQLQQVTGVPCSRQVEEQARQLGIPLATLEELPILDLTIDGADEVDPALDLIKGGGGALLHEKIVAQASRREVIVVDESKLVPALGTHFFVPVEVIPFGWRTQVTYLEKLGAQVEVRRDEQGEFFRTDEGNYVLNCTLGPIDQPYELAAVLGSRAGIVEHGLFLGLATDVIIAGPEGVRHITRPENRREETVDWEE